MAGATEGAGAGAGWIVVCAVAANTPAAMNIVAPKILVSMAAPLFVFDSAPTPAQCRRSGFRRHYIRQDCLPPEARRAALAGLQTKN